MKWFAFLAFFATLAFDVLAAPIQLTTGLAGSWWNPTRSGEGFVFETSKFGQQDTFGVYWYTYTDDRKPVYLVGFQPRIATATSITVDMYSTEGARFGANFATADVKNKLWGKATFSFESCSAGTVKYEPVGQATGTINIERFGSPLGYTCTAIVPGQTFVFPVFKGNWQAYLSTDSITGKQSCFLSAKKKGTGEYDVALYFVKPQGLNRIILNSYVSASSTAFLADYRNSYYRVDQNTGLSFEQVTLYSGSLPAGQPATLDAPNAPFKALIDQMNSGTNVVIRVRPDNQFVSTHEATFDLATFRQAKEAFNYCLTLLPSN